MSLETIYQSLLSSDITPGSAISTKTPARVIYHQKSQDAMILGGIHVAITEALSNISQLERTRGVGLAVTQSQMDLDDHVRRARLHVESISQMADNFGQRLLGYVLFLMTRRPTLTISTETIAHDSRQPLLFGPIHKRSLMLKP